MIVSAATPHLPGFRSLSGILGRRVYELYNNYVLKNPFYEVEMPVRAACAATASP